MIKYTFWKISLVAAKKKKMNVEKLETESKEDTLAGLIKV